MIKLKARNSKFAQEKLFDEKLFWMKKIETFLTKKKIIDTLWISRCDFIFIRNIWLYLSELW